MTAIVTAMAVAFASPAWAEVMDKEPTIGAVWISACLLAVVALLACWRHPALGLVTLIVALGPTPVGTAFHEIHDPSIGSDILLEAGVGYLRVANAAIALVILGHAFGILLHVRRRRLLKTGERETA